ncbi:MAG: MFS transporter [Fibrobacterales bacterium]
MLHLLTPLFTNKTIRQSALLIFFAFGAIASFQYHGVVMEQNMGLSPKTIGTVFMIGALASVLAPLLVSVISALIPNPNTLLSLVLLTIALLYLFFPSLTNLYAIYATFFTLSFSVSLVFTIGQTNIQIATRSQGSGYFLFLRSIATLGFAISCLISSFLAESFTLQQVYYLFALFAIIALLFSLGNRSVIPTESRTTRTNVFTSFATTVKQLSQKNTFLMVSAIFLANTGANMGSTLVGNFMQNELNGTNAMVGTAWYIATFAEVPLILLSITILKRFELKTLIAVGISVMLLRMALISITTTVPLFYLVQTLHGLFYGATLAGTSIFFKRVYGEKHLHLIQVYSAMVIAGLGGGLAGKLAGLIWEWYDLRMVYLVASLFGVASLILFTFFVKVPREEVLIK